MDSSYWTRVRRSCAALGSLVLLASGAAFADSVTLPAQKAANAGDGGTWANPIIDGQFDAVFTGANEYVYKQTNSDGIQSEKRTAYDFQLPQEIMQSGVTVTSAVLHVPVMSETVAGTGDVITVNGIPGSGAPFVPDDFEISNPIANVPIQWMPCCQYPASRDFDVGAWVQTRIGNSNNHLSFTLRIGKWDTFLVYYPNATLTITYTPVVGNAPTLQLQGPFPGTQYLQGDPITFVAMAFDPEDGPLDAAIQWTSSKDGVIGAGPSFETSTLSAGAHTITAKVVDSSGNVVTKTTDILVLSNGNTPPTLTVMTPVENQTFVAGQPVNFSATASDAEDGDRTANIQWTSNISGVIGSGGSFSASNLAVGNHQIIATVYDTKGNSASWLVNIVVQAQANTAPAVTINSPGNGALFTAGVQFSLSGTAIDQQQGVMSGAIQWLLDGTTQIATGASANVAVNSPGAHTITARVTDSGGLTGEQTVNVTVQSAPPPPASYCSLRGTTSTYEWIAGVKSGTVTNPSGNNGGYRDFTAVQFNMNVGAGNPIVLTPGFSGSSYTERWNVYIDYNHDMAFGANELALSAMTPSTLSTTFTIPATALTGATRMRVILSYGTTPALCGSFQYGEVEDYTVNIQGAGNPPPPPPPPPPGGPSYCASKGTTSSYEFIQQITVNGTNRVSNNNSGYADFTATTPIPLQRGANSLQLAPGFMSSSYNEQWMVWIDFNRDGVFGNEDWVLGGGGNSTVNGTATVPASAASGTTRMRIQMKYASAPTPCETFDYGEVEDYSVTIP